jgi:hypothetical protein
MNDRQNAKLTMFETVKVTCADFQQVYAGVPAFAKGVSDLSDGIVQIHQVEQQQSDALSKVPTTEKTETEVALVQSALHVAGALYVYGFDTDNADLRVKMNLNKSQLFRMENNVLYETAGEISRKARAVSGQLTDYGVSYADLAELDARIAAFDALIVKPRATIGQHKLYTGNLTKLFAAVDSILYDRLDKLVIPFKVSRPDFYNSYKNARNVINTSARKRKPGEGTEGEKE